MKNVVLTVYAFIIGSVALGCGASYDDTANKIGTRNEARVLEICATDDASTCSPSKVRVLTRIAFCANQEQLVEMGDPFDGGPPCPKK